MTTVKKENVNVLEAEKALKEIRGLVSKEKDLNLVENETSTGFSYFAGKKRLCKLLKTKKGVRLEINVKLPKELSGLDGMESISLAFAKKKHLGTMKHLYKSQDTKLIPKIMVEAIKVFRSETTATETKEAK